MKIAFFHEDDYCQWEVLPLTAKAFCLRQMGEIDAFSQEHKDGPFFTDMYIREEGSHTIRELNLRSEQLEAALDFLPAYDRVETGYASYREELKSTKARGLHENMMVFWSVDKTGYVDAIWLDLWIEPDERKEWHRLLSALGRTAPILLADWGWSCCVDLTDAQAIGQYIEHKLNDR